MLGAVIPEDAGTDIVTELGSVVTDNWVVFAAAIGLTVGIAVIRKFVRV